MKIDEPLINTNKLRLFIAVPHDLPASLSDPFSSPELFHIVEISYETAVLIGESPFAKHAFEAIDNYPIEPFEDPFFEPEDISILLKCLEKWNPEPNSDEAKAFLIVKNMLLEAKDVGVGIYFKF